MRWASSLLNLLQPVRQQFLFPGDFFVLLYEQRPRRNESMARCLAAVISHAPGFSGIPSSGQSSSAATKAS